MTLTRQPSSKNILKKGTFCRSVNSTKKNEIDVSTSDKFEARHTTTFFIEFVKKVSNFRRVNFSICMYIKIYFSTFDRRANFLPQKNEVMKSDQRCRWFLVALDVFQLFSACFMIFFNSFVFLFFVCVFVGRTLFCWSLVFLMCYERLFCIYFSFWYSFGFPRDTSRMCSMTCLSTLFVDLHAPLR